MFGQQEIVVLIVIGLLSLTGLWPHMIRALRELRGEEEPDAPAPPAKDELCYRILGVSPSASWKEIEQAYRSKARIHHPDLGGDDDAMRALNEAYSLLKHRHSR